MMADFKEDVCAADGISVEVKLNNGGYFPAFLINIINGEALIRFPYNWMPENKYNFRYVRFPPAESTTRSDLKEKMIAEVLINQHQGFHKGWFKCCIQMLKSEFCLIDCLHPQHSSDFDYICNLRKVNMNPKISMDMLHVRKINMPENLREYAKCKDVHSVLKNSIKSAFVNYDADRGELVIISRNIADIFCAKLLETPHLEALSQTAHVLKFNRNLQTAKRGGFTTEFTVPTSYLGWAIGQNRMHLRAAEGIKGVITIQVIRRSNKIVIHGETEEAVKEARNLLEIKIKSFPVLEEHMSQLFGKKSENMCKILDASGAAEIYFKPLNDSLENKYDKNLSLCIVGTAQAVQKAEILLQYEIDHICEVQRLRGRKRDLIKEIEIFVKTDRTPESVVFSTQTTSTPKTVSFINSSNYNMEELEELDHLNELLLEDYYKTGNPDVILERNIDFEDNAIPDINLVNTTRITNQEDLDLVDNKSRLNVSVESNRYTVLDFKSKPETPSSENFYEILRKRPSASGILETRSITTQMQQVDPINLDTRTVATQTYIDDEISGITKSGEIDTAYKSSNTNDTIVTLCPTLIEVKSRYFLKETKRGGNGQAKTSLPIFIKLKIQPSGSSEIDNAVYATRKLVAILKRYYKLH